MKLVALALACTVRLAQAQPAPPPATPASEADRLFEEGRALMTAGKFEEACTKFELSIAKDPRAIGVLMNLGLCNERRGKVATALKLFEEALARATDANLERARQQAQDEITKLGTRVPRATIVRAAPPLADEKLVVDDQVVPSNTAELPLDPGHHVFTMSAPGHMPFETRVDVEIGARVRVDLPVLELPKRTVITRTTSSRRAVGKVATLIGGGVVLVGGGLAYYAHHDYRGLFDDPDGSGPGLAHCGAYPNIDGKPTCDTSGQSRSNRDSNIGTAGIVVGVAGLVATATGLALWLTAPDEGEHTTVMPMASATTAGLVVSGRF